MPVTSDEFLRHSTPVVNDCQPLAFCPDKIYQTALGVASSSRIAGSLGALMYADRHEGTFNCPSGVILWHLSVIGGTDMPSWAMRPVETAAMSVED